MNKLFISIITFSIAFLISSSSYGENNLTYKLSLSDVIKMAKERNLDLLLAEEKTHEAQGYTKTIRSNLLPNVTGSVSASRQERSTLDIGFPEDLPISMPSTTGPYDLFYEGIRMDIPLINRSIYHEFLSAKANEKLTERQVKVTEEEIISQSLASYFQVLCDNEAVKVMEKNVNRYEVNLKMVKDKKEAELGTDLEVKEAEVLLSDAKTQLKAAETKLFSSISQLKRNLDIDYDIPIELIGTLKFIPIKSPDLKDSVLLALKQRPDFLAQKEREIVVLHGKNAAESAWLPTVDISGRYGEKGETIDESVEVWDIGLKIDVPIWDSFKRQGDLQQKRSQLLQTQNRTEDLRKSIEKEIGNTIHDLETAMEELKVAKEYVELEERKLKLENDKYAAGTSNPDKVLSVEVELANAQFQEINAVYIYNLILIKWFKSIGEVQQILTIGEL